MTNEEFIKRAAITTAELVSAGKLNDAQANKFIDYVFDLSVLKGMVRLERFTPQNLIIDKIGVGSRVAVPKAEAVDPAVRNAVTTSKVTLTPSDIMVPFEIGDNFKRFNIEGDSVEDHIIRMMAAQLANDLDELWIDGNPVGAAANPSDLPGGGSSTQYVKDSYLALQTGFLKLAESGVVVDAENAALTASVFNEAILSMPVKYRKNSRELKFLISPDHEQGYRESVSQRATPTGDNALQSTLNLTPFGSELVPIPLLQRNPQYVQNSTDGGSNNQLDHAPITNLSLHTTTLGPTPETAYILTTDYTQNLTNGTWYNEGGGIPGSATVKATYNTKGKMLYTNPKNLIIGIGMDIKIERDRNIYKGVNEFAITVSVACQIENSEAVVLVKNIKDPL
jgi:hypothetical protein